MAISDKIRRVIKELPSEGTESQRALLDEILNEARELINAQESANEENARRRKANERLNAEVAELKEQLEKANNLNPELEELREIKGKYEAKIKQEYDVKLSEWNKKAEIFAIPETDRRHANIQAAKEQFVFPADEKATLTDEQLSANLKAYNLLDMAGYFKDEGTGNPPAPPRPAQTKGLDKSVLSSGQALFKNQ